MAMTAAERQRRRRARLKAQGFVDVTVTVPRDKAAAVRRFVCDIMAGRAVAGQDRLAVVLQALRDNRKSLEALGVIHAGVFGSTARGDYRSDSDVDVLIETNPDISRDFIDLIAAESEVKKLLGRVLMGVEVDVAERQALKPGLRDAIASEVVNAY